jgi:hypothetical protein
VNGVPMRNGGLTHHRICSGPADIADIDGASIMLGQQKSNRLGVALTCDFLSGAGDQ